MQKIGTVIKIPAPEKNGMQIVTVAFDSTEADLCSIKSTDRRFGCTGCSGGCTACGKNTQETGLLVVQGNIVNALNSTGKQLHLGKKVEIFISEKAAFFQGICAVGVPLVLSALFFTMIFLQTKNENLALTGLAGGIAAGVCIAFGIRRIVKERALPKVITVYE